jgi:hypothetical protein
MLVRDRGGIAKPGADDVNGVGLGQFRLPGGSAVLKQLRPRRQASPVDDPVKRGAQVDVRVAVSADDVNRPYGVEVGSQLWKASQTAARAMSSGSPIRV